MPIKLTTKQEEAWSLLNSDSSEILLFGGSRSGKTFLAIYYILMRALTFSNSRHLIGRKHLSHIRASLIHDTIPKVCKLISPSLYDYWNKKFSKSHFYIEFPNGSSIWFNGFSDHIRTEKVLGNEYSTIMLNEISQFNDYKAIETLRGRLAQNVCFNRMIYDCNPTTRGHWGYKKFVEGIDPIDRVKKKYNTQYMLMNPSDNQDNLPESYISEILENMSSRQRARFRDGLWQNEVEGALWTCELIEKSRKDTIEQYDRIVVAIDPAVTSKSTSDECGIMVGGLSGNKGYVLEDMSDRLSPQQWAQRAINAYHYYKADAIVAEVNNGGDLVKTTIHLLDDTVRVKQVRATRGKIVRSEPIVALYEENRVHHTKVFDELENQMTSWTSDESYSPDRMDALVWLMTELLLNRKRYIFH